MKIYVCIPKKKKIYFPGSIWHLSVYFFKTMQRDKQLKRNQTAVLSGNNRVQVERCAPKRLINGTK